MDRTNLVLAVLAGAIAFAPSHALAEDPQKLFDSLFGEDARKAAISADTKDDVALAGKVLDAAKQLKDDPKSQAFFLEKTYDYGIKNPAGYAIAIEAVKLLADRNPVKKAEYEKRALEVCRLQYKYGTGSEKAAAGAVLIGQSMVAADALAKESKWAEATALYREALSVATAINSPRSEEIQAKIKAAANSQELELRIKQLEAMVKNDPENKAAARALVLVYLVDMDKPDEAMRLLTADSDEALRKYIPLAAKPLNEVPEAGCLGLGEWYESLAATARAPAKPAMLSRARGWYQRFLDLHTKQDAASLKVKVDVAHLDAELQKLGVAKVAAADLPATLTLDLSKNVPMKLVLVPAGKFMMGSSATDKDREVGEVQHEVTITKSFYVGVTEVTQEQYETIMGKNPSHAPRGGDLPVQTVRWEDAGDFCRKVSQKTGKTVRLPTEAEWEYACRAGTKERFFFGDSETELSSYAWIRINADDRCHSVGRKKPNAWGLHDMCGNVWEWCSDWYGDFSKDPATDPTGPTTGTERLCRGGSIASTPQFCRSASRGKSAPDFAKPVVGFRVVADAR